MVNNKFVIDSHCHIYPEKIAEKAVRGTDTFYDIISTRKGLVSDMLEQGEGAGIDHFIVQSVATTPHQVSSINKFIAKEVSLNPNKLTGLGTLHPLSEDIRKDVEELVSLGLKGVKLHPDIQNFNVDFEGCLKIYEECGNFNLPVLMHTGDNRYDHSNPNRLLPILKKYNNVTFIGAHFGGWSIWEQASKEYKGVENLYVDCSSSFYSLSKETAKKIIYTYGVDKVLFGTDYPMWDAKPEIDFLLSLGLKDEEYSKIFSENAKKVFKVNF